MAYTRVEEFIENAVKVRYIPGAVLAIANSEEMIYCKAFGTAHSEKQIAMTEDTLFDCASLTKVVATAASIFKLLESGQLDLDDAISYYFPELAFFHAGVTVRHLLTHTSGFQSEIKFYREPVSYKEVVERIASISTRKPIDSAVIYSDVNYILLGIIIEKITNESLDRFANINIFEPLKMAQTLFNPKNIVKESVAATEYRDYLQDYQWGEVHDENALHFGGVSGHAGLFSTAPDLIRFAQAFMKGKTSIFTEKTKQLSKQSFSKNHDEQRGLGWQLYSQPSFSGQYLQDGFGHTGFTGTSIWVSDEQQLAIVLLTNRVHFGRTCQIQRLRRIVHNSIALDHVNK
ncbi:serine hydrolase domain-containing protein [Solibacillus daqui]|uniref:serine hydrolase domain-containing protein n=1 Tax=Solibacillus daqui TaxID=2912187 RepID=UPI002365B97B|nr:serine hydrolase domain-containing protein [Solibacillus daqui]